MLNNEYECRQVFRDKSGNVIGYEVVDKNGKVARVDKGNLKNLVSAGQIAVVNLTLTSDGRMVSSNRTFETAEKQNEASKGYKVVNFDDVKRQNREDILIAIFTEAYKASGCKHMITSMGPSYVTSKKDEVQMEFILRQGRTTEYSVDISVDPDTQKISINVGEGLVDTGVYAQAMLDKNPTKVIREAQNKVAEVLEGLAEPEYTMSEGFVAQYKSEYTGKIKEESILRIIGNNVCYVRPAITSQLNRELTIPSCVSVVANNAFRGCKNLAVVKCSRTIGRALKSNYSLAPGVGIRVDMSEFN